MADSSTVALAVIGKNLCGTDEKLMKKKNSKKYWKNAENFHF